MKFFTIIKEKSVRIPNKNFVDINGYPLWWHLISELDGLDVTVNTDSKKFIEQLKSSNFKNIKVIEVPGTWELVHATNALLEKYECDGVISIGVIIRGETSHYDLISQNVVSGLMNLTLNTSKPVTLGILATENEAQAEERSNPNKLNKGKEFAQTILEVLNLNI